MMHRAHRRLDTPHPASSRANHTAADVRLAVAVRQPTHNAAQFPAATRHRVDNPPQFTVHRAQLATNTITMLVH